MSSNPESPANGLVKPSSSNTDWMSPALWTRRSSQNKSASLSRGTIRLNSGRSAGTMLISTAVYMCFFRSNMRCPTWR